MKRIATLLATILCLGMCAAVAHATKPQAILCFPGTTTISYTVELHKVDCPTCSPGATVDTKFSGSFSYINGCKTVVFKDVPAGWYYANAKSGYGRDSNTWPPVWVSGTNNVTLGKLCFDQWTNPVNCH